MVDSGTFFSKHCTVTVQYSEEQKEHYAFWYLNPLLACYLSTNTRLKSAYSRTQTTKINRGLENARFPPPSKVISKAATFLRICVLGLQWDALGAFPLGVRQTMQLYTVKNWHSKKNMLREELHLRQL